MATMEAEHTGSGPSAIDPAVLRRIAGELTARDVWPREQLLEFQRQRLQATLRHAVTNSSYYHRTLGGHVARSAPLSKFPVLTKSQLVANFDDIVTDSRLHFADIEKHLASEQAGELLFGQYRAYATGGTSGERVIVVYDQPAWETGVANTLRFLRGTGSTAETRAIGIGASSPLHISNGVYAELRAGRAATPALYVTMPIGEIVDALNAFQPEVIVTYPSFIRRLAEEQQEKRLRISPRQFGSVAETLTPDLRLLAQQTWGAKILNRYNSTETFAVGSECEHVAGIHLPEDLVIFEVADDNNMPVPTGVHGHKLLITTLTNAALPLIRYELSDIVAITDERCACGRPFARITSIEGRREEILNLPRRGGGTVAINASRLQTPLLKVPGVRQFQAVPLPGGLEIRVSVRDAEMRENIRSQVEKAIGDVLSALGVETGNVNVSIVDSIVRVGTGAKEKLVVKPG